MVLLALLGSSGGVGVEDAVDAAGRMSVVAGEAAGPIGTKGSALCLLARDRAELEEKRVSARESREEVCVSAREERSPELGTWVSAREISDARCC